MAESNEEIKHVLTKIETPAVEVQHAGEEGAALAQGSEKRVHKYDSKWEIIDKIKASDEQSVVINIFKVHPEATWKEIKEVYREFQMKIEKVANKEGMFNLHFRNHNDAINFIKVSPKPVLDKKFLMRLNERIRSSNTGGWNEMGADGHTSKFETMKYYKSKANGAKKNFGKKNEEGEVVEGGEQSNAPADTEHQAHHHHHHHHEEEEESTGLDLPTRAHQHGSSGPKRFIGDTKPDQGFGQRNHHKGGAATEVTKKEEELVKPAEIKKEKQVTEEWSTMKDPVQERKNAEDAKRKQQKEKEAAEKKQTEAKNVATAQAVKEAAKKQIVNFSDGW